MIFQNREIYIWFALLVITALSFVFLGMVVVAKRRRDVREQESLQYRELLFAAIQAQDETAISELLAPVGSGSLSQQANVIALFSILTSQPWWRNHLYNALQNGVERSGLKSKLLEQLSSKNAVRRGTSVVLGSFPPLLMNVDDVAYLLADPEPTVRYAVVGTLEAIGNADAAEAMISAIHEKYIPESRVIERLNHDWAVPTIVAHLSRTSGGDDERVRCALLKALHSVCDSTAAELVLEISLLGTDEERIQAMKTLAAYIPRAESHEITLILGRSRNAIHDSSPRVRAAAVSAIGLGGLSSDVEVISPLLSDPDWFVRRESAQTLAALGTVGVSALRAIAQGSDTFAAHRAEEQLQLLAASRTLHPNRK